MQTPQKLIPGLLASVAARSTTTPKLPGEKWLAKWICLKTDHHPKLKELETAVGRFCSGVWESPTWGRLLVLAGENGTGKTHCAKAVRDWIIAVGPGKQFVPRQDYVTFLQCMYVHWPKFLDTLKNGGWEIVEDAAKAHVLIIDELGGGHDPSLVGVDKLCQILSRREEAWTLITTNVLPEAWETTFDRRVASRFFRNSEIVDLSNVPDYSLK